VTAGATRYLREDGTWNVPAGGGGGGSPTGAAGGDLAGSYPNPTVAAVHATGGTLDGVRIGASVAAAGNFTGITTPVVTTGSGGLTLQQTGDSFGSSTLALENRSGANGAVFSTTGPDLVDFGFLTNASSAQYNLRFEHRNTSAMNAANTNGEMQILDPQGTPAYYFGVGNAAATLTVPLTAPSYRGPATAPSGSCTASGAWVFSQDGHATFCASGTWVTKI
jgi:hypothetical protein